MRDKPTSDEDSAAAVTPIAWEVVSVRPLAGYSHKRWVVGPSSRLRKIC